MSNIPTWVIILFFVLLVMGIKACFTRTIRVERIVLLPLVFVFLNIHGTFILFGFDKLMFAILLIGWIMGTLLGIVQIKNRTIQAAAVPALSSGLDVPRAAGNNSAAGSHAGTALLAAGGVSEELRAGTPVQADKSKHLITIPGDIFMFFIIMGIFFIEFFIHYAIGAQWAVVKNSWFNPGAVFFSGLLAGLFIGRCGTYFYKYHHSQR